MGYDESGRKTTLLIFSEDLIWIFMIRSRKKGLENKWLIYSSTYIHTTVTIIYVSTHYCYWTKNYFWFPIEIIANNIIEQFNSILFGLQYISFDFMNIGYFFKTA